MKTKHQTNARRRKLEAGRNAITAALAQLEANEAAIQAARQELKTVQRQLAPLLADVERYPHAMRALNTIAMGGCERQKAAHTDCLQRDAADRSTWCWPCYAKHVVNGGTP